MRSEIICCGSVEIICMVILLFVMSYKEKIPKQVLDILIIVLGIAMVVVSCILIAFAIKNGVKKRWSLQSVYGIITKSSD